MARKIETVEIERFPLEPVRRGPHVDDRRQPRLRRIGQDHLHPDVLAPRQRVQVVDRFEPGRPAAPFRVVDAGQVEEEVVRALRVVAQEARDGRPVGGRDLERRQVEIDDRHAPGQW